MRTIELTHGQVAEVDDEDFERVSVRSWRAQWDKTARRWYAAASGGVLMHRLIMGLKKGDPMQVDHRNPEDTLNNQKYNLRLATRAENQANRGKNRNNTTGFKGVHQNRKRNCLQVSIGVGGKNILLGRFTLDQLEQAALCYRRAAIKYHGDFARVR